MKGAIENSILQGEHLLSKSFLVSRTNVDNYWAKHHGREIYETFLTFEQSESWVSQLEGDTSAVLSELSKHLVEAKNEGSSTFFTHEKIIELWENHFFEIVAYLPFGMAFYFISFFPANFKSSIVEALIKKALELKDKDEVMLFIHRLNVLQRMFELAKLWTDVELNDFLKQELKRISKENESK